jgi:hypothetical protein
VSRASGRLDASWQKQGFASRRGYSWSSFEDLQMPAFMIESRQLLFGFALYQRWADFTAVLRPLNAFTTCGIERLARPVGQKLPVDAP